MTRVPFKKSSNFGYENSPTVGSSSFRSNDYGKDKGLMFTTLELFYGSYVHCNNHALDSIRNSCLKWIKGRTRRRAKLKGFEVLLLVIWPGKEFKNWAMMRTVMPASAHAIVMNSNHGRAMENQKEMLQGLSAAVIEAYNMLPNLISDHHSVLIKNNEIAIDYFNWAMMRTVMPASAHAIVMNYNHGRAMENQKEMLQRYDGQRAQIHKLYDGSIRVFSRNRDDTTSRFPDVISIINDVCKSDTMTFIIDVEVVAVDRKSGPKLLSFQELSYRDRGGGEFNHYSTSLDTNWMGIGSWLVYESNTLTSHRVALHHSIAEGRPDIRMSQNEVLLNYSSRKDNFLAIAWANGPEMERKKSSSTSTGDGKSNLVDDFDEYLQGMFP
ncbi:DNA ligase 6 isoform X1 [Tanacetum coccineum]